MFVLRSQHLAHPPPAGVPSMAAVGDLTMLSCALPGAPVRLLHTMGGDCAHGARGRVARGVLRRGAPPAGVGGSPGCCLEGLLQDAKAGTAKSGATNTKCQSWLSAPPACLLRRLTAGHAGLCRYHQYKFIVDGEWRHDEMQPFMPDPLGNVNNWLFVRRPEPQPPALPQQQQQHQPVPGCAKRRSPSPAVSPTRLVLSACA